VVITYHCNPGYDVAGVFWDQVTTKCLKGPYYSHNASDLLTCGTLACKRPPKFAQGSYDLELVQDYAVGRPLAFSCDPGLSPTPPSGKIECGDGGWSETPKCDRTCGPPPTVGNAVPSNPNPTAGTTVTYRCKDGLVPYGNNFDNFQVRCGADHNFDLTGADLPECIPPACKRPPGIRNGEYSVGLQNNYPDGEVLEFSCEAKFEADPPEMTITCNGKDWDARPACKAECGPPPEIENAESSFKGPENPVAGDVITFTCLPDLIAYGENSKNLKTECLNDGSYKPEKEDLAECVPIDCKRPKPEKLENGRWEEKLVDGYTDGQTVEFSCNDGFRPDPNDGIYECAHDGWIGTAVCLPPCGDLEAVENGTYEFSFDDELKKFVADLVCNERFQILPAELNRLICNVETRMWEGDIGKCYTDVECGEIPSLARTSNNIEWVYEDLYLAGTKVFYVCEENYKMVPPDFTVFVCTDVGTEVGEWIPNRLNPFCVQELIVSAKSAAWHHYGTYCELVVKTELNSNRCHQKKDYSGYQMLVINPFGETIDIRHVVFSTWHDAYTDTPRMTNFIADIQPYNVVIMVLTVQTSNEYFNERTQQVLQHLGFIGNNDAIPCCCYNDYRSATLIITQKGPKEGRLLPPWFHCQGRSHVLSYPYFVYKSDYKFIPLTSCGPAPKVDGANEEVTGQVEVYDGIVSVQQVTYTCSDGKKLTPPTSKIINCSQESHKFVPDPPTCE